MAGSVVLAWVAGDGLQRVLAVAAAVIDESLRGGEGSATVTAGGGERPGPPTATRAVAVEVGGNGGG